MCGLARCFNPASPPPRPLCRGHPPSLLPASLPTILGKEARSSELCAGVGLWGGIWLPYLPFALSPGRRLGVPPGGGVSSCWLTSAALSWSVAGTVLSLHSPAKNMPLGVGWFCCPTVYRLGCRAFTSTDLLQTRGCQRCHMLSTSRVLVSPAPVCIQALLSLLAGGFAPDVTSALWAGVPAFPGCEDGALWYCTSCGLIPVLCPPFS